jgi:hypothetical protein
MRRHNQLMLWRYIGLVFSFAFRRTTVAIDASQVVVASALPAVARFAGVPVAADTSSQALAYIGLAAIAFIALRLVSAPYFAWREQVGEIGALKLELSKPERIELESLAKKRAKVRLQIARCVGKLRWKLAMLGVFQEQKERDQMHETIGSLFDRISSLGSLLPTSATINRTAKMLHGNYMITKNGGTSDKVASDINLACILLVDFLHGNITGEDLLCRLPEGTAPEKRP